MSGRLWFLAVLLTVMAGPGSGQEIHLKTRIVSTASPAGRSRFHQGTVHQIIQFDHAPGAEDLSALAESGERVLAMVPDNAVMVSGPRLAGALGARRWVGELDAADKLSPELGTAELMEAVVEFHSDVERAAQDAVAARANVTFFRPAVLLANHALVTATMEQLQALAEDDGVAYIFPADPELAGGTGLMTCAGMLTLSGPVAQYSNIVHGWNLDSDHVAHLSYFFGDMTMRVPEATAKAEVVRALAEWSKYAKVTFEPGTAASAARTVLIRFASGAHGDAYPFSATQGILAHTFYPVPVNAESIAGDIHLNVDEDWHAGGDVDIYSVALHEAGHAIGLGHTDKPGDVMYPYYRRGMQLSANDIRAAQALYGPAADVPATEAPISTVIPVVIPPVAAIVLTIDPVPPPAQTAQVSLSGTFSGGIAPLAVQWQSDHGTSGLAVLRSSGALGNSGMWSAANIGLVTGTNVFTVTVFDSAHQSTTHAVTITRLLSTPVAGSAPVSISITSPAGSVVSTYNATITLAGKASGGAGVTQVVWQMSGGASGTATGVGPWVATNVPLFIGTNTIVVRAVDAKGASAWANAVVVRR